MRTKWESRSVAVLAILMTVIFLAGRAFAHCDTTSGPIIPETRAALEKGDVTPILK